MVQDRVQHKASFKCLCSLSFTSPPDDNVAHSMYFQVGIQQSPQPWNRDEFLPIEL